ncbi:hypothetical protein BLA29_013158, partial [Euroglyphus maynei]
HEQTNIVDIIISNNNIHQKAIQLQWENFPVVKIMMRLSVCQKAIIIPVKLSYLIHYYKILPILVVNKWDHISVIHWLQPILMVMGFLD